LYINILKQSKKNKNNKLKKTKFKILKTFILTAIPNRGFNILIVGK
jgi:hypothetical protein